MGYFGVELPIILGYLAFQVVIVTTKIPISVCGIFEVYGTTVMLGINNHLSIDYMYATARDM